MLIELLNFLSPWRKSSLSPFAYNCFILPADMILTIKPTRCTNFKKFIFGIKLYMFRKVPLSIFRSFSLYTQQWYMSYRFADSRIRMEIRPDPARKLSANLYDIYHCCVYSVKLLMVDRETVRNMQSFIPEINLRN